MNENDSERQMQTLLEQNQLELSKQTSRASTVNEEDKKEQEESIDGAGKEEKNHVSSQQSDDEKDSNSGASQKSFKSSSSKKEPIAADPQSHPELEKVQSAIEVECEQKKQVGLQQQEQMQITTSPSIAGIVAATSEQKMEDAGKKQFKDDPSSNDDQASNSQAKKKNVEESKEEDNTSSESDDEQEADEILANESSSAVIEVSPKGRFNRYNEELGRGAYKIVYKGLDTETGREIAWNVVNLRRLSKIDRIRIKSEIDLIKKLQHPNIIRFISAWINKPKDQVIFITEMITGGTLRKYVKKIQNLKLKVIKKWCHEILEGLIYLHEQKPHPIIHRDLKCDNVFINSHSGDIRIGDLGLSTPMQNSYSTSVLGTPEFMAPELYEECYDTGVDIYAFGMCVLEMVTLERPYKECQNPAQIYNKVIQGIRPQALERIEDEDIKNFILLCLSKQMQRPTARQLLESSFLQDIDSEKNMQIVKVKPQVKGKVPLKRDSFMKQSVIKEVPDEENTDEDDNNGEEEKKEQAKNEKYNKGTKESSDSDSDTPPDTQTTLKASVQDVVVQPETIKEQMVDSQQQQNNDDMDESNITNENDRNIEDSNKDTTEDNDNQNQDSLVQQQLEVKEEESDLLLEKRKKKMMKNKIRNQKLDESFNFLKQIDKEKHKKMKQPLIQTAQDSSTMTPAQQQNLENILDKLRLDDEGDKKKDKKQVTQNNALMIEKKKNFKEDKVNNNLNQKKTTTAFNAKSQTQTQIKPQQLADSNKQQVNIEFGDLKRQSSKDLILHANKVTQQHSKDQDKKQQNVPLPTTQHQKQGVPIQISKQIQQPHHQPPQNDSKKQNNYPDNNPQHNKQFTHNSDQQFSFENQLKNSQQDSDEFHDSDVDKITIDPHVAIRNQEEQKRYNNVANTYEPLSAPNDHNRTQQQQSNTNGSQTQKNPQGYQPVQQNKDQNFGQYAQHKIQTNMHTYQQNNQVQSPLLSNQPQKQQEQPQEQHAQRANQPQNKQYQQQQPQNQQQAKPQQQQSHHNSIIGQQQQKNPASQSSQMAHNKSSQEVVDDSLSKNINLGTIQMKFKIQSTDGSEQDVTFEFDTNGDTPQGVAQEMVQELMLPPNYSNRIAKFINDEVQQKKNNLMLQQKNSQQKMLQSQLHQQQQLLLQQQLQIQSQINKKGSPAKISKDLAFNSFKVLQDAIDNFYLGLQSKGIELNEFVEALEISEEEKSLKVEFLNNMQMARVNFKNKMDDFKKRVPLKKKNSINLGYDTTLAALAGTQNGQVQGNAQTTKSKPLDQNQQFYQGQNKSSQNQIPPAGLQTKKTNGVVVPSHQGFGTEQQKQYNSFRIRREGSHNDIQQQAVKPHVSNNNIEQQEPSHFYDNHFQQQSRVDQTFQNKQQVGTHHSQKVSSETHNQFNFNISLPLPSKFHSSLFKGNQNQNEEDVKILQNTLNVIYHVSISQNKSEEELQNFSHQYLKVDGMYGDKTKNFVMKFQESASLPIDGVVSDYLWKKLVYSYEKIQKEDQIKREKIMIQQQHNKDSAKYNQQQQLVSNGRSFKEKSTQQLNQQQQQQFYHQHQQQQQQPPLKLSPSKYNNSQRASRDVDLNTGSEDNGTNNEEDNEDDAESIEMVIDNNQTNPNKFTVRQENGNLYQNYAYQSQQQHQQQMHEYDQDQNQHSTPSSQVPLNKHGNIRITAARMNPDEGGLYDGFSQQLSSSSSSQQQQQNQYNQVPGKQLSPQQQHYEQQHLNKNGGPFKFHSEPQQNQPTTGANNINYYGQPSQTPQDKSH